jgi:hypothetical protein
MAARGTAKKTRQLDDRWRASIPEGIVSLLG